MLCIPKPWTRLYMWEHVFTHPSSLPASQLLSMQKSPHHPAGNLGVDSQQTETVVVVLQLIQNPLAYRFAGHCFALSSRFCRSDICLWLTSLRRTLQLLQPGCGAVQWPWGDAGGPQVDRAGRGGEKPGGSSRKHGMAWQLGVVADTGSGGQGGIAMTLRQQIGSPGVINTHSEYQSQAFALFTFTAGDENSSPKISWSSGRSKYFRMRSYLDLVTASSTWELNTAMIRQNLQNRHKQVRTVK